jgi:hypothetical protein
VTRVEGRALQSEGNGPVPWSGLQTEFVERAPRKNASAEPSTKDGSEAVRLGAFALPGSPLDRHRVVVFHLSMSNPVWRPALNSR